MLPLLRPLPTSAPFSPNRTLPIARYHAYSHRPCRVGRPRPRALPFLRALATLPMGLRRSLAWGCLSSFSPSGCGSPRKLRFHASPQNCRRTLSARVQGRKGKDQRLGYQNPFPEDLSRSEEKGTGGADSYDRARRVDRRGGRDHRGAAGPRAVHGGRGARGPPPGHPHQRTHRPPGGRPPLHRLRPACAVGRRARVSPRVPAPRKMEANCSYLLQTRWKRTAATLLQRRWKRTAATCFKEDGSELQLPASKKMEANCSASLQGRWKLFAQFFANPTREK
jgi:hypothetical protein